MGVENGVNDYTQDGTVDLKGNPVRRSKRGGWTACSFVVGNSSLFSIFNPTTTFLSLYSLSPLKSVKITCSFINLCEDWPVSNEKELFDL